MGYHRPRGAGRPPIHFRSQTEEGSVYLEISTSEEFDAFMRVVTASGLVPGPRSKPDKQETPEVGASEVSTNQQSSAKDHGGCSPKRKR